METRDLKNLKKRYLIWFYKTTKEALDKIERKFTQVEIDRFILSEIKKGDKHNQLKKFLDEFKAYIQNKEKEGIDLKFREQGTKPEYLFLDLKLKAIEKTIIKELGKAALEKIKDSYEQEMIQRILGERQQKL